MFGSFSQEFNKVNWQHLWFLIFNGWAPPCHCYFVLLLDLQWKMPIFLFPIQICFVWDTFLCDTSSSQQIFWPTAVGKVQVFSLFYTCTLPRTVTHQLQANSMMVVSPSGPCCCGVSTTLFSQVNQCMRREVDKEPVAALSMISTHLVSFLLIFFTPIRQICDKWPYQQELCPNILLYPYNGNFGGVFFYPNVVFRIN